ncbi:MAG: 3-keto-5-aminohexanoate cleavage protein [Alphaproteobacteria bacterium]|nr:3-keto-5-aminohexanoate cleavage protein [Alphaproteobacteria bacterium]HPF47125.1 3-keto-5-aminohexanoate cleavage protein [Emcibacteraceae bacterium]HRW28587.1 3-keto-5-aminohexanoate cleavage protein [Emcibacteraceae bacterium]
MTKTILTCAVTGNLTSRDMHPKLPVTPKEIAEAALEAAAAGAAIVHLHVRDPKTGKGSMEFAFYDEMVSRIREKNTDVILNLTTGEGGRFVPSKDNPKIAAENSTLCRPELRVAHIEKLKPEICTLDLNTMWSGQAAVINTPENLKIMAERIYAAGVKPEIEIFNSSDMHLLNHFIAEGVIKSPVMVQMVMGVRFGIAANSESLLYLKSQLPENAVWAAFGIGRMEYPMLAQSFVAGGHVRVGMEDNLYIKKGELCEGNAQLVEKAVRIIHDLGGEIATTDEARKILGLN